MQKSCWETVVIHVCTGILVLSALHNPAHGNQQFVIPVIPQVRNGGIAAPLTNRPGNAERGRRIVLDRERGDCVVCHALPLPARRFHGTLGLPLDTVGQRYTAAELRLRLLDPKALNPHSIMPAYYKGEGLYSVLKAYRGKPILTAQEIEDVVAYLLTLRNEAPKAAKAGQTPSSPRHKTSPHSVEGRRSGSTYLSKEHRQLQDDAFGNPGMLWVERGRALWDRTQGDSQQACASCHADAVTSMRGVRTRYPQFDPRTEKLINLEQRINRCRTEQLQVESYPYESEALLALSAFVSFQSRGMPLSVDIKGLAAPFFEAGKAFFMRRRGQLDMACSQCHDEYAGQRLRGEVVSQGQTNGFPVYRLSWQTLGSAHRMFAWCNTAIRAHPLAHGADDYVNLELYLAWRGRGLAVETPGVRR